MQLPTRLGDIKPERQTSRQRGRRTDGDRLQAAGQPCNSALKSTCKHARFVAKTTTTTNATTANDSNKKKN